MRLLLRSWVKWETENFLIGKMSSKNLWIFAFLVPFCLCDDRSQSNLEICFCKNLPNGAPRLAFVAVPNNNNNCRRFGEKFDATAAGKTTSPPATFSENPRGGWPGGNPWLSFFGLQFRFSTDRSTPNTAARNAGEGIKLRLLFLCHLRLFLTVGGGAVTLPEGRFGVYYIISGEEKKFVASKPPLDNQCWEKDKWKFI